MRVERKVEEHNETYVAPAESSRQNRRGYARGTSGYPRVEGNSEPETEQLLEQIVSTENMNLAWKLVKRNKGTAGIDGRDIDASLEMIREHWAEIKERVLNGSYQPLPVKRVEIPKSGGGKRKLGVPTVLDRLIQQAIYQVLSPLFESGFSESSYGFRPGRNAHQAVWQARSYQEEGKRWVVDMDLKAFFDEVDHDVLMGRVRRKVKDPRVNRLINQYLKAGVLIGKSIEPTEKGTPQGGPLSPLLANILLDDLDKELERRGHSFCRYADDCNIYVNTHRTAKRVLRSVTRFVEVKLNLKVNQEKSAVGRPWKRKFLGYSFTPHHKPKIRVAPESIRKFRSHLKELFRRGRGRKLKDVIASINPVIRGWTQYFYLTETKGFAEELDGWIRRRLRVIIWRQGKRGRTRYKRLLKRGLEEHRARLSAFNGHGPWWNSGASHMNDAFRKKYFDKLGLVSMLETLFRIRRKVS